MSARGRRSTLDGDGSDSDEELIVANPFVDEEAPSYIERAVFPVLLPAIEQVLQSVKKGEEVTDPIGIIAYLLAKHNPNPYATTPGQRSKYLESVVQRMDDKIQRKTSTPTTRSNSSRQRFSQSNVTGSRSRVVSQMTSNSSSTTSISMSLGSSAQP
ncbi:hypothetical protein HK105_200713 [Polyrhizophydium stewartii]|uniref:Uncharacterized protein n=1 Tax=Polyrhizophydium stewartii TaxID=2732419 RepID=A0ABR4NJW0_9FUNG